MNVLLLSTDKDLIEFIDNYTTRSEDSFTCVSDKQQAKSAILTHDYDAVMLDCSIRPSELIAFTGEVTEALTDTVVLLLGPLDHDQREKLGRRLSAQYSIDKPLRSKAFQETMQRVTMRSAIVRNVGLIGRSAVMEEIIQTIMQVGPTPISILLSGESGSGKEVVAKAIHAVSHRADKPFLAVNCAALAEGILESELFGHEKGSFTGAVSRRIGMFEKADGGTIFLDEIGEIPHSTQVRLLRVLEEREIMRVGGTQIIQVNVRVITATNRNMEEFVNSGKFRRDLYYRIKVLEIPVPALKKRPEDIPLLIDRLARNYAEVNNFTNRRFDDKAKQYLSQAYWPGNVRELRNFVESTLALTSSPVIALDEIPEHLLRDINVKSNLPAISEQSTDLAERVLIYRTLLELKNDIRDIKQLLLEKRFTHAVPMENDPLEIVPIESEMTLDTMERQAIMDTLEHTNGNRRRTAEMLGIGERTLYRKLKEYGIK